MKMYMVSRKTLTHLSNALFQLLIRCGRLSFTRFLCQQIPVSNGADRYLLCGDPVFHHPHCLGIK